MHVILFIGMKTRAEKSVLFSKLAIIIIQISIFASIISKIIKKSTPHCFLKLQKRLNPILITIDAPHDNEKQLPTLTLIR